MHWTSGRQNWTPWFILQAVRLQAVLRSQLWTSQIPEAGAWHRPGTNASCSSSHSLRPASQKKTKSTNQNKSQLLLWDKLKSFTFVPPFQRRELFRVWPYLPVTLANIFFFPGTDLYRKGKKLMAGIIHPVQHSMRDHWPRYLCCSSLCPVPPVPYFVFHMFFHNCPDLTLLLIDSQFTFCIVLPPISPTPKFFC